MIFANKISLICYDLNDLLSLASRTVTVGSYRRCLKRWFAEWLYQAAKNLMRLMGHQVWFPMKFD